MKVIGPTIDRVAECESVLRSLPEWFGIEDALLKYATDTARYPTFAALHDEKVAGFITLREHFAAAWEIHCVAVRREFRNHGIGSILLGYSESWLAGRTVRFLQVKTVAHTSESAEYAQTRAFYSARGFTPIEVFPALWSPQDPALQLIKALRRG